MESLVTQNVIHASLCHMTRMGGGGETGEGRGGQLREISGGMGGTDGGQGGAGKGTGGDRWGTGGQVW